MNREPSLAGAWPTYLVTLLFFCGTFSGHAVEPAQMRFFNLSVEHGLSQPTAKVIFQDRIGFLWVGTQDGLNRYDGYTFKVFRHDFNDPNSVAGNNITALMEDSEGGLWVGTQNSGLSRYDPASGRFTTYRHNLGSKGPIGNYITALVADAHGGVWIGTTNGLSYYQPQSETFRHWPVTVGASEATMDERITALLQLDKKSLLIGTQQGLYQLHIPSGGISQYTGEDGAIDSELLESFGKLGIRKLLRDRRGRLWIGTLADGAFLYDPEAHSLHVFSTAGAPEHRLQSNTIQFLLQVDSGRIWIGTRRGLAIYSPATDVIDRLTHGKNKLYGISSDYMASAFQDQGRVIWIGTWTQGLNKVDPASLAFSEIATDHDGNLGIYRAAGDATWVGTTAGLAVIDKRGKSRMIRLAGVDESAPGNDLTTFTAPIDGRFLYAGSSNGVNRIDIQAQTMEFLALEKKRVYGLLQDRDSSLWVGTRLNGLYHIDSTSGEVLANYPFGFVTSIYRDYKKNILWIGTLGGLRWIDFNDSSQGIYTHTAGTDGGPSQNMITWIMQDRSDEMWIGTQGGGLDSIKFASPSPDSASFEAFGIKDGLAADAIGAILEDGQGKFWVSTTSGISRFDPQTRKVNNYGSAEGASSSSYYIGSGYEDTDGTMYFGGPHGVTRFHPDQVKDNPYNPPVIVTALRLFNQSVDFPQSEQSGILELPIYMADSLNLSYENSIIEFEFSSLHFSRPANNRYAYKLEGFSDKWVNVDASKRFASYTNLKPGHYVFKVRGTNKDGLWSSSTATLKISISPPWWQTNWARVSAVLLILLVFYLLVQLRTRRIRRTALLLREQVKEQTRSLQEANRRLELASRKDFLTKLPNRRLLTETGNKEIAHSERSAKPLTVLLADLDDFKKINDTLGHDAGDHVLQEVARIFRDNIRSQDTVGRWGGEEFLFILPETDLEGGVTIAENVCAALDTSEIEYGGNKIHVTATFGVSQFSAPMGLNQCVSVADQALYRGKDAGKNRVAAIK